MAMASEETVAGGDAADFGLRRLQQRTQQTRQGTVLARYPGAANP